VRFAQRALRLREVRKGRGDHRVTEEIFGHRKLMVSLVRAQQGEKQKDIQMDVFFVSLSP